MNEDELGSALRVAHGRPHTHYVDGVEIGHHRLRSLARLYRDAGYDITCGLELEHPRHEWNEFDVRLPCPGLSPAEAQRLLLERNQAHGLGEEVQDKWALLGHMGEAKHEDGGTTAYTEIQSFSESATEWIVVHSESDEGNHALVDRLAGKLVRVTIEIIG